MRLHKVYQFNQPHESETEYTVTLGLDPSGFTEQEWNDPKLWKPVEDADGYPEGDYQVKFYYDYQPAEKGSFERGGRQLTPDYPESIEITGVDVLDPQTRQWFSLHNYEMYLDVQHWEDKIREDQRDDYNPHNDYDPREHMSDWDDDYDPRGD